MGTFRAHAFEKSREFTKFQVDMAEEAPGRDSFSFQVDPVQKSRPEFAKFEVDAFEESRDFTKFQVDMVEARREFARREAISNDRNRLEVYFQQALHLTSLAFTDVASVKAFLGRWKVIETRLLQLPALLGKMSQIQCLSNNIVCSGLLKGLMETLEESRNLAMRCTDLSYNGKLQTQSNLDALCGRLDFHIHDCQLLITGGIMHENPTCRDRPESTHEAMKWTIQDLLAHLQIGSIDNKERALDSMVRLMSEDDKNILMVTSEGAVATLVHLLDASQPAIREKAAAAIRLLALNDTCEQAVVAEGGIAPLIRLLDSGSSLAQEKASAGLQGLSVSGENARAIASHGGVAALVEVCRAGTPASQTAAAGTLRNLAAVDQLRKGIVEDGAVPIVINLVISGTPMAQENAAATLQNLAVLDDSARRRIVENGAIQPLMLTLDCSSQVSAQEIALGALRNLAACRDNIDELCMAGFLPRLAACLRGGPVSVQLVAANAVCHIACSTENRILLGGAGVIGPLIGLLDAKSHNLQECSAQALALLLLAEENQKLFLAEDSAIAKLILQIDVRFNVEIDKQYAVSALQVLSGISKCKKQMIMSGACYHLRQLADKEVPGAAKLLDKLEGGKLKSIISKTLMINSFTN